MATTYFNGVLVSSAASNQVVPGTGTTDTIVSVGNLASSTLDGAAANDTIAYGGGDAISNFYDGGSQDDYLIFNSAGFIETNLNNITVFGGTGSDYIGFGTGNSIGLPGLFPLSGDYVNITDSLIRGANGDPNRRPDGNDYISFGGDTILTRTLVNGNEGDDDIDLYGILRNSTVQGGQGADVFYSDNTINDSRINGNLGNDEMDYDAHAISGSGIFGGQGDDDIDFDESELINTLVSGDIGADTIDFDQDDSGYLVIVNNSTISGGQDADYIEFENDDDFDYSQVVASLIDGGVGNDTIDAEFNTRISQSTLLGGDGSDSIYIEDAYDGWAGLWNSVVDGGSGDDEIDINAIGDSSAGITSIFGGEGSDTLYGDSFTVGAYWSGDAGNDVIEAGNGKDTILGGSGNDTIDGEEGGDRITGGSGNDIFEYWSDSDSYVTGNSALLGSNIDTITDFDATVDRFRLDYNVENVRTVSAGFSTDWQTTVNTALGAGNYGGAILADNDAAIMTITSGTNAGTYMLYHDRRDADIWRADYDGIVLLSNATGTVTTANFLSFF